MRTRIINTYCYCAVTSVAASPEQIEAMGQRAQAHLQDLAQRLGEFWEQEWLPEIKRHLAYFEALDLQGAAADELRAILEETIARFERLWQIHFRTVMPVYLPISIFEEFYRDLFGAETTFDAYRLLQGFDNKTIESDRALWQLSRSALASPVVRRILEEHAAADVISVMEQSSEGQAFLAQLRGYLEEYGQRGNTWNFAGPSWREDPTPVMTALKDYITQRDRDLPGEMAALADERERRLAETRERLKDYPQPIVQQFEGLLKAAQTGTVLTEEHGFWIDFRSMHQVRRVLMECGRRLAQAGVIEQPGDVFYLNLDELRDAIRMRPGDDRREIVAARKAEMEHFRTITPPPVLGTQPPGPPPDNPMTRMGFKFGGGLPPAQTDPRVISGNAGSPGRVRGQVKVISSLGEAQKLRLGDILVAETTAPPWTPLFSIAAAVVTDTGGILSHCAVVAREYGIPAVVGTGIATAKLQDGQLVEVDGDAGIVRIDLAG
jgi:pyruvate,water dikinase